MDALSIILYKLQSDNISVVETKELYLCMLNVC